MQFTIYDLKHLAWDRTFCWYTDDKPYLTSEDIATPEQQKQYIIEDYKIDGIVWCKVRKK